MPAWMHDRAEHIMAKNPSMPKSEAFAIATQQGHAVHKLPKRYGTAHGKRVAKAKYDTPRDDNKMANPGGLESPKMNKQATGFTNEYDGDGNLIGRTTREQELHDIFSRDGSFGFDGVKMSAMKDELIHLVKASMPITLLANAAKARGFAPESIGALKQVGNKAIDPSRRRDIAKNVVGFLRQQPKVVV